MELQVNGRFCSLLTLLVTFGRQIIMLMQMATELISDQTWEWIEVHSKTPPNSVSSVFESMDPLVL